jgi:hypothetical protein
MRQTWLTLIVTTGLAATAAGAETVDCPALGLDSAWLTEFFCSELGDILGDTTRAIEPDETPLPNGPGTDWVNIPLLQDAWRVDPRKTLELIDRIRTAGGLPEG